MRRKREFAFPIDANSHRSTARIGSIGPIGSVSPPPLRGQALRRHLRQVAPLGEEGDAPHEAVPRRDAAHRQVAGHAQRLAQPAPPPPPRFLSVPDAAGASSFLRDLRQEHQAMLAAMHRMTITTKTAIHGKDSPLPRLLPSDTVR